MDCRRLHKRKTFFMRTDGGDIPVVLSAGDFCRRVKIANVNRHRVACWYPRVRMLNVEGLWRLCASRHRYFVSAADISRGGVPSMMRITERYRFAHKVSNHYTFFAFYLRRKHVRSSVFQWRLSYVTRISVVKETCWTVASRWQVTTRFSNREAPVG